MEVRRLLGSLPLVRQVRADDGRAFKCTLCYDRLKGGMEPACAHACPTDSIQFGPVDELRERAAGRLGDLRAPPPTPATP